MWTLSAIMTFHCFPLGNAFNLITVLVRYDLLLMLLAQQVHPSLLSVLDLLALTAARCLLYVSRQCELPPRHFGPLKLL